MGRKTGPSHSESNESVKPIATHFIAQLGGHNYPATGYHHITACAGGAQEDVNFFTGIVGQRLAKQTILMDGRFPHYHLYYSNANIEPGWIMTTFPYNRLVGRRGPARCNRLLTP